MENSSLQSSYSNLQDVYGMSTLHSSAKNGHVAVVDLLLDTGGDVHAEDNAGWTPLHHAASNGKANVVELLLDKSSATTMILVNAKTKNGSTPLSLAISSSKLDVAYILMDHGALLQEETNNKGKTPLDMAPTQEMKAALLEYSQRNKEKVVIHQIGKLLCSVKTGRIALSTLNTNTYNTNYNTATMQQQRAGKRPRPRW